MAATRAKPKAMTRAIMMASKNRIIPEMVLPLNISRRELVRGIPGIRSMMLPMLIISTDSPSPTRTAREAISPPRQEQIRAERKPLAWVRRICWSRHLSATPMRPEATASRALPPKNREKEAEMRA